jgi:hypothetical protein
MHPNREGLSPTLGTPPGIEPAGGEGLVSSGGRCGEMAGLTTFFMLTHGTTNSLDKYSTVNTMMQMSSNAARNAEFSSGAHPAQGTSWNVGKDSSTIAMVLRTMHSVTTVDAIDATVEQSGELNRINTRSCHRKLSLSFPRRLNTACRSCILSCSICRDSSTKAF